MPIEELRKVIAIGGNSYGITAPKGWIEFHNLSKRDRVKMVADRAIAIFPSHYSKEEKIHALGDLIKALEAVPERGE